MKNYTYGNFKYNIDERTDDLKWDIKLTAPRPLHLVMHVKTTLPAPTGGGIFHILELDKKSKTKLNSYLLDFNIFDEKKLVNDINSKIRLDFLSAYSPTKLPGTSQNKKSSPEDGAAEGNY